MSSGRGCRPTDLEILGSEMSAGALALRTYAARQQLPHTWVEIDTPAGAALARAVTAAGSDLPVVITPTAVLRHATPGRLAGHLGLSYQRRSWRPGPADRTRSRSLVGRIPPARRRCISPDAAIPSP